MTIDRTVGVVDDGVGDGDGDDDDGDGDGDGDDDDGDGDGDGGGDDGDAMLMATVMVILILILNRCILFTVSEVWTRKLGQVFDKKGMLPRESVQIRDSHTGAPGPGLMSGGKPETAMGDPQIQSNW